MAVGLAPTLPSPRPLRARTGVTDAENEAVTAGCFSPPSVGQSGRLPACVYNQALKEKLGEPISCIMLLDVSLLMSVEIHGPAVLFAFHLESYDYHLSLWSRWLCS